MKVYYNSLNEPYSSSHETTKTSQRSTLQLANIWTRCPTQRLSLDSYSDAVLDRNKTCSHKENMWSINYPLVLLTISILSFFHRKKKCTILFRNSKGSRASPRCTHLHLHTHNDTLHTLMPIYLCTQHHIFTHNHSHSYTHWCHLYLASWKEWIDPDIC